MKVDLIRGKDATVCAGIGLGGALVFLFAFPKGAISTLMHEVLHLPGPGAGIALILGPFLVVAAIISASLSRGVGGAATASLTFAAGHILVVRLLGMPTDSKGTFGSALFVIAVVAFGMMTEVVMAALRKRVAIMWCCGISGALANSALLVIYWVLIFPRTAGWIRPGDIPILTGLCLAGGLVAGCFASAVSRPLSRALAGGQPGADHVRPT